MINRNANYCYYNCVPLSEFCRHSARPGQTSKSFVAAILSFVAPSVSPSHSLAVFNRMFGTFTHSFCIPKFVKWSRRRITRRWKLFQVIKQQKQKKQLTLLSRWRLSKCENSAALRRRIANNCNSKHRSSRELWQPTTTQNKLGSGFPHNSHRHTHTLTHS